MSKAQELIALAKGKLAAKDWSAAEGLLNEALRREPDNANVYIQIGQVAYQRSDNAAASAAFERAMGLDPSSITARAGQIKLALRLHHYDAARGIATDLVKLQPSNHKILAIAAKTYFKAGDYSRSAQTWENLGKVRPTDPVPMIEAANTYLRAGAAEQAKTVAEAAQQRFPKNPELLLIKAHALDALDDFRGLGATLDELASIDPRAAVGFLTTLISSGRPTLAANVILKARELKFPVDESLQVTTIKVLIRQARAAEQKADNNAAAALWRQVMMLDADNSAARSGLRRLSQPVVEAARAALEQGRLADSRKKFKEALAIDPINPRRWIDLAKVSEADEAWVEAADAWLRLGSLDGQAVEDIMTRACRVARKASDHTWALTVFLAAKKAGMRPEAETWGSNIARKVYKAAREDMKAGERDRAFTRVMALLEWEPKDAATLKLVAQMERLLARAFRAAIAEKDAELATKLSEQWLMLNPTRIEPLKHLARYHFERESFAAAWPRYAALTQQRPTDEPNWARLLRCAVLMNDGDKIEMVAADIERRFAGNEKMQAWVASARRKMSSKKT